MLSNLSYGQLWTSVNEDYIAGKSAKEREIVPKKYASFKLDTPEMLNKFKKFEKSKKSQKAIEIELPFPDGKLETFYLEDAICMSPKLAAKFPDIKCYRVISKDNPLNHGRIDIGTVGFHAAFSTAEGTVYVDPYFRNPDKHYISYYIKDDVVDLSQYEKSCGVEAYSERIEDEKHQNSNHETTPILKRIQGEQVIHHKYRLAVSTTGEWGRLWGTTENVMSRIVTGVNRINMIYENEIAVTFELVDDNDELIFLDPDTDPFVNASDGGGLLDQNSFAINSILGSGAYDIGHIFTINCVGVAGIAALGSVCLANKGNGVSCVNRANISAFMVNTTAHEIGHQFNGGHSWNNCPNALGQLSPSTAWEPGSGSTILSYAGSCGNQNIENDNDDYFHVGNLGQFLSFIDNTARCAESTISGNHAPDVEVPFGDGLFIPIGTPFELDGEATDEDGDILTYNWEQMDVGPVSDIGEPIGNAPLFRSYPPSTSSYRSFPRLNNIISFPSNAEVLPLVDRNLTFRFTVKDNHAGAGITVWEEIQLMSTTTAGPFTITSPSSIQFVEVGEDMLVEWDVANTDNDIVNCQSVDIYFSSNKGKDFDFILKSDTPNDGSEMIKIPNAITNEGRIKIKARDNVFFQINRSNIIVREPDQAGFFLDLSSNIINSCIPELIPIQISSTSFQSFDSPVTLSLENVPQSLNYSFTENPLVPGNSTELLIDPVNLFGTSEFNLILKGVAEGADTIQQEITLNLTGTDFSDMQLQSPVSGLSDVKDTPTFIWSSSGNADFYTLEISTNPAFGNSVIVREELLTDTSFLPQLVLGSSQLYYWRVLPSNDCNSSSTEIRTFGTIGLDCREYRAEDLPKNISLSGNVDVEGTVKVFDSGQVADVNVKKMRGQHSDIFQVRSTLISPKGTEVVLWDRECFTSTDFNIGFDMESPVDFICPINSGITMKPKEGDLADFNDEEIEGDWVLRIEDLESGEGGQFTEFILELCASFSPDNPYLINNDTLKVLTSSGNVFSSDLLLVGDNNNTAEELTYTIVKLPRLGSLVLNGNSLIVGDQFTQAQINNTELKYIHEGTDMAQDSFVFTVIDGQGGWLDLTTCNIAIGPDFPSSTNDLNIAQSFKLFPNPSHGFVTVESEDNKVSNLNIEIYGLDGKRVQIVNAFEGKTINLSNLDNGLYIFKISDGDKTEMHKINFIKN